MMLLRLFDSSNVTRLKAIGGMENWRSFSSPWLGRVVGCLQVDGWRWGVWAGRWTPTPWATEEAANSPDLRVEAGLEDKPSVDLRAVCFRSFTRTRILVFQKFPKNLRITNSPDPQKSSSRKTFHPLVWIFPIPNIQLIIHQMNAIHEWSRFVIVNA